MPSEGSPGPIQRLNAYIIVGILSAILWVLRQGPFLPPILPRRARAEVDDE